MAEPPAKRRRPSSDEGAHSPEHADRTTPSSLSHPISPPRKKRVRERARITSPFRLTSIRDLSEQDNVDAVSLNDIVGDPLIAELWDFNYLHDIDFLMKHLDDDTRALTEVHVVHGFWKREDPKRVLLQVSPSSDVLIFDVYRPVFSVG
jgi:tyrosyl-DNA phosphodiesterase-1